MERTAEKVSLEREVVIAASPETVGEFLVDPEKATRWMGMTSSFDPRPGGLYQSEVIPGHTARGEFVEIDAPRRLVFTWGLGAGRGRPEPGAVRLVDGGDRARAGRRRDAASLHASGPADGRGGRVARPRLGPLSRAARDRGTRRRPRARPVAHRRDVERRIRHHRSDVASSDGAAEPLPRRPLPLEVVTAWLLFVIVAIEILVTYSRLPAHELYHVSGSGLSGGASRVLVFSNFPTALVAIAVLALLADRTSTAWAIVGIALCAAVFWPGVVDQADLDAKPVNALAALGVLTAIALTAIAWRQGVAWSGRCAGDSIRLAAAAAALFVGLPWIAADVGFFLTGVPGLGWLFQTGQYLPPPFPPAVHHGHHHGMDGVLLLISAALLSRVVPSVRPTWLRVATGAYLALMAAYGIGNIANDAWLEQVVKRGWTTWAIPNVLRPGLTIAWGVIVLGAAALYAASARWSEAAR
jgi:uncharacterized protein YndB with AHSA1/START domain